MKKYTDEDVERFTSVVSNFTKDPLASVHTSYWQELLDVALAPFRPDPEEELLVDMCIAFDSNWYQPGTWESESDGYKKTRIQCMAAALAVVKERGLPQ